MTDSEPLTCLDERTALEDLQRLHSDGSQIAEQQETSDFARGDSGVSHERIARVYTMADNDVDIEAEGRIDSTRHATGNDGDLLGGSFSQAACDLHRVASETKSPNQKDTIASKAEKEGRYEDDDKTVVTTSYQEVETVAATPDRAEHECQSGTADETANDNQDEPRATSDRLQSPQVTTCADESESTLVESGSKPKALKERLKFWNKSKSAEDMRKPGIVVSLRKAPFAQDLI